MLSKYIRTKEREGIVAVFHELHPRPAYMSKESWNKVIDGSADVSHEIINKLIELKILVNSNEDDNREFRKAEQLLNKKLNQATILYLMTAQGCNFNCGYCSVPEIARKYGASTLSNENAFAGIDLWQKHIEETFDPEHEYCVIFYGGEPLLNKQVITDSLEYISAKRKKGELPEKLSVMIATNGALVDLETIALCKKHNVIVAVGLDGSKESNDALKVDENGNGTFDKIVAAIKLLVEHGVTTCVSTSITPHNINQMEEHVKLLKELGVEKFGFNFLKGKLLLKVVGKNNLESYYRQSSKNVIELSKKGSEIGYEYQMEKKRNAFNNGDYFPVECTCYGNQLVIQPDGEISNCPFTKSWLGQVSKVDKSFRIWNQSIVKQWRERLSIYQDSEAKSMCSGGCAWSSVELTGNHLAVDESSRIFSEEVLDDLIWSNYKAD